MLLSPEAIQDHIPKYLTAPLQEELFKNLKGFPENFNYYWNKLASDSEVLQGDGWRGLELVDFSTREHRSVKGIVLSNSCDIAPENERDRASSIVFAPLIRLSALIEVWKSSGISEELVEDKVRNIRLQRNTKILYLPHGAGLSEEYIAHLDDIHSFPASVFLENRSRERLFSFTTAGFYLFVIKLSVHFCRLHENVMRTSEAQVAPTAP